MSNIKINPGKPAVFKTVEVEPAVPTTVTVTMPLAEALFLAAIEGKTTGSSSKLSGLKTSTLFGALMNHPGYFEASILVGEAIAHRETNQNECGQSKNVSLHPFPELAAKFMKAVQ